MCTVYSWWRSKLRHVVYVHYFVSCCNLLPSMRITYNIYFFKPVSIVHALDTPLFYLFSHSYYPSFMTTAGWRLAVCVFIIVLYCKCLIIHVHTIYLHTTTALVLNNWDTLHFTTRCTPVTIQGMEFNQVHFVPCTYAMLFLCHLNYVLHGPYKPTWLLYK